MRFRLLSIALLVVAALPAAAQESSSETGSPGAERSAPKRSGGGGMGITRIAEDTYFETELGFDLDRDDFRLAISIPLRFRITDLAPPSESVIREFDWDEPGDYISWIRYVRYGRTRFWGLRSDPYYVRVGELQNVSIGHGSIVAMFDNQADFDHRQWGLHADVDLDVGGAEVLLDDFIRPGLMGTRLFVRPGSIIEALSRRPAPQPPPEMVPLDGAPDAESAGDDGGIEAADGASGEGGADVVATGTEGAGDAGGATRSGDDAFDDDGAEITLGDPVPGTDDDDDITASPAGEEEEAPLPWGGFQVGATFMGDVSAPYLLRRSANGEALVDRRRNFRVEESRTTGFLGVDAQVDAYRSDVVRLIPFIDLNSHVGIGRGMHLGTFANFDWESGVRLNSRFEMRVASSGYEPAYFDAPYEAQRYAWQALSIGGDELQPKLLIVDRDPDPSRIGWYTDFTLAVRRHIRMALGLGDYAGRNNAQIYFAFRLVDVGPSRNGRPGPIRFALRMSNNRFDKPSDMFDPANLLVRSALQVQFLRVLFVKGTYERQYEARRNRSYRPVNSWGASGGLRFVF